MAESPAANPPPETRRHFLQASLAVVLGGIATLVPLAAGLMVYVDPLRRRQRGGRAGGEYIPVTPLSGLPADDKPRKFEVITDKVDAWTKTPNVAIGAVFLKRDKQDGKDVVTAWNVVCPHAGCFIDVAGDGKSFRCPCHNSSFHPDGTIVQGQCVSPRGMDRLDVDSAALAQGEVRVRFQNFSPGTHDKKPVT
jgi:menaquinol-cytochrome c reductase iron-sulfur subunit